LSRKTTVITPSFIFIFIFGPFFPFLWTFPGHVPQWRSWSSLRSQLWRRLLEAAFSVALTIDGQRRTKHVLGLVTYPNQEDIEDNE